MKYKCTHCGLVFSDKNDEGILSFRGKLYCKNCEEPVVEIPDQPQTSSPILGAQTTLISNSDNRIITNNYYGGGTPDEKVETLYGPCRKNEAHLCNRCHQWIPLAHFNQEKSICRDCELKQAHESFEEGKHFYEMRLYDDAINCFLEYESVCSNEDQSEIKTLLGRCYYELKDYKQALKYFVIASRNNTDSLCYLGLCYYYGYGVESDEAKALELIQNAANQGHQQAIDFLKERQRAEELYRIRYKGLWGFMDRTGKIVIPCQWYDVGRFSERLAPFSGVEGWGYINIEGKVVIPIQRWIGHEFKEGLARVWEYGSERWGFIDKTGKVISQCQWEVAYDFVDGLANVKNRNGKWGCLNKTGEIAIPCRWEDACDFSEGLALVKNQEQRWGYIDKTGKTVIPCQWRGAHSFQEGLARVKDSAGNYGFIDRTGKIISQCQWYYADEFWEGLARVLQVTRFEKKDRGGMWSIVKRSAETAMSGQWKFAFTELVEGLDNIGKEKEEKYGFIDKTGKLVVPCQWKYASIFDNGLALVKDEKENLFYVDKYGTIITPKE